ncbi:DUF5777 family beta-barrel protein [Pontibacter roseus]|uniref:DUF5777 family beta-barrel protein n=1 Tax=Pontibacter roseus TaxID=336989 RepID=UPI00036108F1|nr:DUF5777 family beta-barrel protein [Pontibacter roseus]
MIQRFLLCLILCAWWQSSAAQDDLMSLATDSASPGEYALPAFKGLRVINGQSVQMAGRKNLQFAVSHRFDRLNRGAYDLFGLDGALIRLGLDYGLTDGITIGVGRSSYFKTYDAYAKYRFLRQTTDNRMPLTAAAFASINVRTQKLLPPDELSGTDRLTYTAQLLLARRFIDAFSLQLSPAYVYRVRPEPSLDDQGVLALGIGGRYSLTRRISLNGEYFYVPFDQINGAYTNALSIGFDIETGGHVFQLHFTNSYGMTERYFITETVDSWTDGDIHFGFNITRTFSFEKKQASGKKW